MKKHKTICELFEVESDADMYRKIESEMDSLEEEERGHKND